MSYAVILQYSIDLLRTDDLMIGEKSHFLNCPNSTKKGKCFHLKGKFGRGEDQHS